MGRRLAYGKWRKVLSVARLDELERCGRWRRTMRELGMFEPEYAHAEQARIPFLIWIAPALRRSIVDDAAWVEAVANMNDQLEREPLSQNDIPTLLLAALAHSAPLRDTPRSERWHTMGGQATSPHFRLPIAEGSVMGIDAATSFYVVDADGASAAPPEPARLVVTPEAARATTPSLHPAAGALRRVLPEG